MKFPAFHLLKNQVSRLAVLRTCVLVALLVVAQLGAFGHLLGHFKAAHDGGQAPEVFCEWCAAYAQTGAAPPASTAVVLPVLVFTVEAFSPSVLPPRPLRFVAYLSQAPPILS